MKAPEHRHLELVGQVEQRPVHQRPTLFCFVNNTMYKILLYVIFNNANNIVHTLYNVLGADDEFFSLERVFWVDLGSLLLEDTVVGVTRTGGKAPHLRYTAEDEVVKCCKELVHLRESCRPWCITVQHEDHRRATSTGVSILAIK
jgi:hypothetical protein